MKAKPSLVWILIFAALLMLWELVARANQSVEFFAGSPSTIFFALVTMIHAESFFDHFLVTGIEAAAGLLIGTMAGTLLGLLMWYYRGFTELPILVLSAIGSVPILAFSPLMIVWFGVGIEMKIALASITTFFISFSQSMQGAKAVSVDHIDFVTAMRATQPQIFRKVVLPGSLSWVFGSMRLNASFCLLGAFVGEFIASDRGLGYLILRASSLYNIPRAFACGFGIACLALVFDLAARLIESEREIIAQMLSVPRPMWPVFSLRKFLLRR
jgi:NitT/TauT family transport system permease protein